MKPRLRVLVAGTLPLWHNSTIYRTDVHAIIAVPFRLHVPSSVDVRSKSALASACRSSLAFQGSRSLSGADKATEEKTSLKNSSNEGGGQSRSCGLGYDSLLCLRVGASSTWLPELRRSGWEEGMIWTGQHVTCGLVSAQLEKRERDSKGCI